MSSFTATNSQELLSALQSAQGGDTILLAGGTYSGLSLQGLSFDSSVSIRSADVNNQAILTNFSISGSKGLSFDHLDFTATGSNLNDYAFRVSGSTNISFDALKVHGSMDDNPNNDTNGFLIRDSVNVTVSNSDFQQLYTGINHLDDNGLTIKGNIIHEISMDGIRGGGSSNVLIDGNHLFSFHPINGDHPDAIQFWTTGSKANATNIVISNNTYDRGDGTVAQGIFVEAGDDTAGHIISGLKILNNTISGSMYNGIAVSDGQNVQISGNTVVSFTDMQSWIRLERGNNISLDHNTANLYILNNVTNLTETADSFNKAIAITTAEPSVGLPSNASSTASQTLVGATGADTIHGAAGDDIIQAASSPAGGNYLRGEGGNDSIIGGQGFDDINGNAGNDTLVGNAGNDWVVGGQGDDLVHGDAGDDRVYGNMGNDICAGGDGADTLLGGQGDDVLYGEAGNDFLSGDRGTDVMTGGAGADTFSFFAGSGADRVTDFSFAEGDRVRIEGGAAYTVSQVGSDTVVDLGNGDSLTLSGVNLASLPAGWIVAG